MKSVFCRKVFPFCVSVLVGAALAGVLGGEALAQAARSPEIRLSQRNAVPQCVTPDRLMAFLRQRNGNLDPRFKTIAHYYRQHGEAWRVRWDYAFFQMAIETNFLSYRRPNGKMGDVDPRQNNFAGIGTTGGGVPGDSFPDVSTGVLGQIQHLVVYSGEQVGEPVASRTRLKQHHILALSRKLNRPVLFSDLARRWAVDPKYASSIEWVAGRYREQFCRGSDNVSDEVEILPWHRGPSQRTGDAGKPRNVAALELPKPKGTVAISTVEESGDALEPDSTQAVDALPAPTSAESDAAAIETASVDAPSVFALFSPPAGFAGALTPEAVASRDLPQPVLDASATAQADARDASEVPVVSEAPADPQAVAGASVGGFLIAGASSASDAKPAFDPPSGLGMKPPPAPVAQTGGCVVETATFGGQTTVLVRTPKGDAMHYVALSVLDGFEDTMTKSFLSAQPNGGEAVGTYLSRDEALKQARTLCPDGG
ncbi:hypothetical protein W911_06745 [Hyphomicrobium nitrativorans NL23]|uniref:Uncharacterized protein n=1 Tax=Hyphomicrobium nitrativorans NL23 TaxID=1029756 RepID=V5SCA0_9HYPH|nr:glucosaminidase domain-containing protein [Hyphomicrobium nitrativorans]AHB48153.1 hypothetical protein W911_06745 [Hyphomicrobium nitrativorans NL23]